jgi:ADP-glucose type glycogen/starch synthase
MNKANPNPSPYFPLGLQISRQARQQFTLDEILAAPHPPIYALRLLAAALQGGEGGIRASAGQLNLLALLNECSRHVARHYLRARRLRVDVEGIALGERTVPLPPLAKMLRSFVHLYPPAAQKSPAKTFLTGDRGPVRREETIIELFLLATQMENPAAAPTRALFDDGPLKESCSYRELLDDLDRELSGEEIPGLFGGSLLDLLLAPIKNAPHSLSAQLDYMRRTWGEFLPADFLRAILTAFDLQGEEETVRGFGPGPSRAPHFSWDDREAFSADADWMTNAVLVAKTIYVWLDQLSRKYRREIATLDRIPDEELDLLVRWGFNALWLIGIWERSPASQEIKRRMGNPEAVSSAYSLYDYVTAADLGGEEALADLRRRCEARGIRLACDVVPNHTGIYSRWTCEHPDWFVQVDTPPFPGYHFTGPDLSGNPDVVLQIEDGYWTHSDAAVVFCHRDRRSGRVRYLYHGNDGTHMPWNDTAQLNFLIPEVREAVIRTILHVARTFRIIRFDAAMTLAKKHFQRLWFPQPGGGAGIPSRSEHWMSREAFEEVFPTEFWREVVDRVAAEAPDTLLLAEAFWLMEGFFVRTLGMHRVYNSAFMHMLKSEENGKYRGVVKEILGFNPEILKRFVNFMNNPDEETAVEQFGRGDKYFGVAVLLATMPGTPMFGHGQVEGLREKYGMEYRRAYWDEAPDEAFIRHHERQIAPLLHRRHLFSDARNFVLYDFESGGHTNDDVFAYSNRCGAERSLVVYHNRHNETGGWLRRGLSQNPVPLAGELGLRSDPEWYCRFRDHHSGLEYLRSNRQLFEEGLYLYLGPYQYHVFFDIREFADSQGQWGELCRNLDGRPVLNLDHELRRMRYAPLLAELDRTLAPRRREELAALLLPLAEAEFGRKQGFNRFSGQLTVFLQTLARFTGTAGNPDALADALRRELGDLCTLLSLKSEKDAEQLALKLLKRCLGAAPQGELPSRVIAVFLPYLALHRIGELAENGTPELSAAWMEEYLLLEELQRLLPSETAPRDALLVKILTRHQKIGEAEGGTADFALLLDDNDVQRFLEVHPFEGVLWFSRERFEELIDGLFVISALSAASRPLTGIEIFDSVLNLYARTVAVDNAAVSAGFRFEPFRDSLWSSEEDREAPVPGSPPKARRVRKPPAMKILLVASEVAPYAKTGGLADVAGSLPKALRQLGHDVRIILPCYQTVEEKHSLRKGRKSVEVPIDGQLHKGMLRQHTLDGVPVYFIENREYFHRDGLYGTAEGDYPDNAERFGFFCRAVLALLRRLDFRPDVLHLNDWQTGLIPVLLKTELKDDPFYRTIGTLMTIHNLGYQGLFLPEVLPLLGLPPQLGTPAGLEYFGKISFLKGGLIYSDLLNTVSPTYCREIQTPQMGHGFDGILAKRSKALHGILNGLDTRLWNPELDPALVRAYNESDLRGKAANKKALQAQLGLETDPSIPLVAMVTRLDTQKGLDLVEDAWERLLERPLQFVLIGSGEQIHTERFARLKDRYPGRVSINLDFDDTLSRRIYAGSDLFLMPSHYEPCGLGQLIALRYGSIPVVRKTGGLADTVIDPADDPRHANGFTFTEATADALLDALDRALALYGDRRNWLKLVKRGMSQDFSWRGSAEHYLELYRRIMEGKRV